MTETVISDSAFWTVCILLGLGTFLIRFSFLGIFGGRELPSWMGLYLKYVGSAVFPALIAPMLLWPEATGGQVDPARLIAAAAAFFAGMHYGVVAAIVAGMSALYALGWVLA